MLENGQELEIVLAPLCFWLAGLFDRTSQALRQGASVCFRVLQRIMLR